MGNVRREGRSLRALGSSSSGPGGGGAAKTKNRRSGPHSAPPQAAGVGASPTNCVYRTYESNLGLAFFLANNHATTLLNLLFRASRRCVTRDITKKVVDCVSES